ncbi:MAG: fibronectin type III domain-containing protein, partial [Cyclobacteriaceae bacterium]
YDTYQWIYGSEPDQELEVLTEIRRKRKKKGLTVLWTTNTSQALDKGIKGFHIYTKDSLGNVRRVNDRLIRINLDQEDIVLTYHDPEYDLSRKMDFYITPVDDWDYTGRNYTVEYTPNLVTDPKISLLKLDRTKEGVEVNWQFPQEKEKEIEGFRIMRRKSISEPFQVIYEAFPAEREFTDDELTEEGTYYYQVAIEYLSGFVENGMVKTITLLSEINVPAPAGLTGKIVGSGNNRSVALEWTSLPDSISVKGYKLLVDKNNKGLAYLGSIPLIETNSYAYNVNNTYGRKFRFAMKAINQNNEESVASDTVTVYSPSVRLPTVDNVTITSDNGNVSLAWTYDYQIEDLLGFNIYQNGVLISEASETDKNAKVFTINSPEPGKYNFTIEAVSSFGIRSEKSLRRNIEIL